MSCSFNTIINIFHQIKFSYQIYCCHYRNDGRCPWWNVIRIVTLKLFTRIPGRERTVLLVSLSEHVRPYQALAFFLFGRQCYKTLPRIPLFQIHNWIHCVWSFVYSAITNLGGLKLEETQEILIEKVGSIVLHRINVTLQWNNRCNWY